MRYDTVGPNAIRIIRHVCPKCGERFAAQFVISTNPKTTSLLTPLTPPPIPSSPSSDHTAASSPTSGEAEQFAWQSYKQAQQYRQLSAAYYSSSTERFPLTVPYLPPRVLHKELTRVVEQHGIGYIVHASFRAHSTALYWNTVWHLLCVNLPVQFMLWELNGSDSGALKAVRKEGAGWEMVHVGRYMSDEQRALRKEKANIAQRQQRKRRGGGGRRPHTPQQLQQPQQQQQRESSVSSSDQHQALSPSPLSPQLDAVSPVAGAGSRLPTVQETHSSGEHTLP